MISADLHDADVIADLATGQGRAKLVARVGELTSGRLDGVLAVAGTAQATPMTASASRAARRPRVLACMATRKGRLVHFGRAVSRA